MFQVLLEPYVPRDIQPPRVQDSTVLQNQIGVWVRRSRLFDQLHSGFNRGAPRLSQVTTGTGSNHVVPGMGTVLRPGNNVVQRQVLTLLSAILAGVSVPKQYLFLGQLARQERTFDQVDQSDNRWGLNNGGNGPESSSVVFQELRFALTHQDNGAADITDVDWNVVEIEDEDGLVS